MYHINIGLPYSLKRVDATFIYNILYICSFYNYLTFKLGTIVHTWKSSLMAELVVRKFIFQQSLVSLALITNSNSMVYGTRSFNAAFTWALQQSLSWAESTQFLVLIPNSLRFILILSSYLRPGLLMVSFLQVYLPKFWKLFYLLPFCLHDLPIWFF